MNEHNESFSGESSFLKGASEVFLVSSGQDSLAAQAELQEAARLAFFSVQDGLKLVEERIKSRFVSEAEILPHIADYLLDLGGKRIRPILALLCHNLFLSSDQNPSQSNSSQDTGKVTCRYPQGLIDVASGIELIHMATLLHDDIIDESPKRRHKESAYSKFGLAPSLLAGDFLWVRAFGLCAHLGEFIVRATESACVELTEGEILEGNLSMNRHLPLKEYETIVSKKTGSLFCLSTAVGGFYAGASQQEIALLSDFGRKAGIAFQMIDDVLDVVADENLLGKPSGTDLKQQTPSLTNVLWLQSGDPRAATFFSLSHPSAEVVEQAITDLRTSPAITEARKIAAEYAGEAKTALDSIPATRVREEVRTHLRALLNYTLARCL